MVRKSVLAVAAAVPLLLPERADALFQNSFAEWQALSEGTRNGFVMGAIDRAMGITGGDPWLSAVSEGLKHCLGVRLKVNAGIVSSAVTDAYRANPDLWGTGATYMLQYVLVRMCEADINLRLEGGGRPRMSADLMLTGLREFEKMSAAISAAQQTLEQAERAQEPARTQPSAQQGRR